MLDAVGRDAVLQCLRELADRDFQERVWLRGQGNEVSTPSELVSQLYDDTGLGDLLDDSKIAITPQADRLLAELRRVLHQFDLYSGAEALLAEPEWLRVHELATQVMSVVAEERGTLRP